MIIATYKNTSKAAPEQIRVHQYSNGELHVEAIGNFYAKEVGSSYRNLEEVEKFLKTRDRVNAYERVI